MKKTKQLFIFSTVALCSILLFGCQAVSQKEDGNVKTGTTTTSSKQEEKNATIEQITRLYTEKEFLETCKDVENQDSAWVVSVGGKNSKALFFQPKGSEGGMNSTPVDKEELSNLTKGGWVLASDVEAFYKNEAKDGDKNLEEILSNFTKEDFSRMYTAASSNFNTKNLSVQCKDGKLIFWDKANGKASELEMMNLSKNPKATTVAKVKEAFQKMKETDGK